VEIIIKIATRKSRLALAQTHEVIASLEKTGKIKIVETIPTVTSGDKFKSKDFKLNGGKGLFIKELESMLLNGEADVAIHSLKDVPAILDERFEIVSVLERECPNDVFISINYNAIEDLPINSTIGTSSPRRAAQLRALSKNFKVKELRGNIETRIDKLHNKKYDAIILAAAGLHRLNLEGVISQYISEEHFVPSAGQGVLCAEFLKDNQDIKKIMSSVSDNILNTCIKEERNFVRKMAGDCMSPIGAYGRVVKDSFELEGFVSDIRGVNYIKSKYVCDINKANNAGEKLGDIFIKQGAKKLINS